MNINNLKKITDEVKLTERIPGIVKQARYLKKRLLRLHPSSNNHRQMSKLLEKEMHKLRYIEMKVPNSVNKDVKLDSLINVVTPSNHNESLPRITLRKRESGYSARQLGVSPRDLREGNFDVARTEELKAYVAKGYEKQWSPSQMKAFIKMTFLK